MPHDNQILVRAGDLRKRYGEHEAVRGVDFEIRRGEAFGFLGANGAGKSTTMRMIGCVSQPTEGTLEVFGRDPRTHGAEIRARLGVVPQDNTLDGMLTVFENLVVYAGYFGIKRKTAKAKAAELLEFVQLSSRAKDQVNELSGGMQRRLAIARSLINEPELVILDEPTTGLDPQARHLVWERLFHLKQRGVSILLTTHYMDEGSIIAAGSPRELIDTHVTKEVVELRFGAAHTTELAELALTLTGVGAQIESLPDKILVYTDDADDTNAALDARDIRPTSTLARRATLEDVFLRLTGRALVEDEA
ncbi:MAG TPA: ABC transporter ATP-binding protein [Glycomyces sp.]|nr:ABC transporter ATP-binding protein [Glycomyces sp.]